MAEARSTGGPAIFYKTGSRIFKAPERTVHPDGSTTISLGFPICEVTEFVGTDGIDAIVSILNGERERELRDALKACVAWIVNLAESGDAGFWDGEQMPLIIFARAALAKAGAE